ncbi:MAG: hypothetical protein D6731_09855 [Planctomycetota bacterium]|nr:MAG: hypothetical protein D6731_09855 [Planctomycetota bacterium]
MSGESLSALSDRAERLLNPVLYKDLLMHAVSPQQSRRLRFGLHALFLAAPLLVLFYCAAFLPGPWAYLPRPLFFAAAALLSFSNVLVHLPAVTAFAAERDRGTFEGLVVSPLSPARLVLGKYLVALARAALARLTLLPPLAAVLALGGEDPGFLIRYWVLLSAADASLAAAVLALGARERRAKKQPTWLKAHTTQTQLVAQASGAAVVVFLLLPLYALLILVPLVLQGGGVGVGLLETVAPLAVVHPLAALVCWGDLDVFGTPVPVWVAGVLFHLLLAPPFLAHAVGSLAPECARPTRWARSLALPALGAVLLLVLLLAARLGPLGRCALGWLGAAGVLLWSAAVAAAAPVGRAEISRAALLRGLWPANALRSGAAQAPGYVLLLALPCGALVGWAGGGQPSGLWAAFLLLVAALSLAVLGACAAASEQRREQQELLQAWRGEEQEGVGGEPAEEQARRSPLARLWLASLLLAVPSLLGLLLTEHGVLAGGDLLRLPAGVFAAVGLSLNPLASFLPLACDSAAFGTSAVRDQLVAWGIDPGAVAVMHAVAYVGLACVALWRLAPPLPFDALVAEGGEAAPSAGASPPLPSSSGLDAPSPGRLGSGEAGETASGDAGEAAGGRTGAGGTAGAEEASPEEGTADSPGDGVGD